MLCCMIARKAGKCKTIARVRNPIYNKEIGFLKEELGLSMVINPEYEAACEIARILRFPSAIDINMFHRGRVELLNLKVEHGSVLDGMRVMEIHSKLKCDILVSVVEREEDIVIPNGEFIIREEDTISIIAPHKKAIEFLEKIGMIKNPVKSTMLIGGGDISYYLAKKLLKYGINVTLIEQDRERCEELSELLPKAMIIHGDGTDQNLLMEEGITEVESLASLTGIDEENILLSLYAKSKMNGKIITKVNRLSFDEVINSLDLGIVLVATLIIGVNIRGCFGSIWVAFQQAFFQVASIITTTGFSTTDFNQWPTLSKSILVIIMFIGACAGSTGGGIKVSRIVIAFKNVKNEISSFIHPKSVHIIRLEGKKVNNDVAKSVSIYLILYGLIFVASMLLISLENKGFETTFTSVAATLNNIGPGLDGVGPMENFGGFHPFSKCVFMFDMLAGRLELIPMAILFTPWTWKKGK